MRNILLTSVTCFVLTLGVAGQAAICDLKLEQSPTVRGLKLGMPENEAALLVKGSFNDAAGEDRVYRRELTMVPKTGDLGGGLTLVSLQSFDGKVSRIRVYYDVQWKDVDEFVTNFTPKLSVPASAWKIENSVAAMRCRDFDLELNATFTFNSYLVLNDRTVDEQIKKLKEEFENDKKKAIKP